MHTKLLHRLLLRAPDPCSTLMGPTEVGLSDAAPKCTLAQGNLLQLPLHAQPLPQQSGDQETGEVHAPPAPTARSGLAPAADVCFSCCPPFTR